MKTFHIVTASLAITGLVLSVVGFATLNAFSGFKDFEIISYDEALTAEETASADTLKVSTGFAPLKIVTGDEVKLVADRVPYELSAHLSAKNDEIILSSKEMIDYNAESVNINGIPAFNADSESFGGYTLYIPESIKKLELDYVFGELDLSDISAEYADISVGFSDCSLNLAVTESLSIDTAFGDTSIDMSGAQCRRLNISSGFGSLDIRNLSITGSAEIDNGFGDVELALTGTDYDIDSDSAFGSSNITGESSSGKVDIDISNGFGSVNVSTGR